MFINTEKTKALLGKTLQHKLTEETASLQLRHDATNIDQLSYHKLLGLIIDKDLSFFRHISPYLKQTNKLIFFIF